MSLDRDQSPVRSEKWKIFGCFKNPGPFVGIRHVGFLGRVHNCIVFQYAKRKKRKSWRISDYENEQTTMSVAKTYALKYSNKHELCKNPIRMLSNEIVEMKIGKLTTIFNYSQYCRLKEMTWHSIRTKKQTYAATTIGSKQILMHHFLANTKENQETDHKDRNGLNNLNSNHRVTTRKGNANNHDLQKNNTSGANGIQRRVCITKKRGNRIYYIANWRENKKLYHKYFRVVADEPEEIAKNKAIAFRREKDIETGCRNGYDPYDESMPPSHLYSIGKANG